MKLCLPTLLANGVTSGRLLNFSKPRFVICQVGSLIPACGTDEGRYYTQALKPAASTGIGS